MQKVAEFKSLSTGLENSSMTSAEFERAFGREIIDLLFDAIPFSIVATALNAVILSVVLWQAVPNDAVVIWCVGIIAVLAVRFGLYVVYKRNDKNNDSLNMWMVYYRLIVFITGVAWGAASMFLFPSESVEHQAFLALVIAGMSAGAVSTLNADRICFNLYVLPAALPLVAQLFSQQTLIANGMGVMAILFFAIILQSARRINFNITENIRLRLLTDEHIALIENNETLLAQSNALAKIMGWRWDAATNRLNWAAVEESYTDSPLTKCHTLDAMVNYFEEEYRPFLKNAFERCRTQGISIDWEGARRDEDNKQRWFRIVAKRRNGQGRRPSIVGSLQDISPYKAMEKMKAEFVSIVSHELRTPLTSINGSLRMLNSGVIAELPQEAKDLLSIAERNGNRLLTLINDLLDVEKLSSGKMQLMFEKVSINELLQSAVQEMHSYAVQCQVEFDLQPVNNEIFVNADHHRLNQVITNLLSNAAKFSNAGEKVRIETELLNQNVRVSFIDRGCGISDDFKHRIFQRFSQADSSSTRKVGGTGLGLNIVKSLVEKMGGNVGFESIENQGSTFFFELPVIAS